MYNNGNGQLIFNNTNNNCGNKLFNYPIKKVNILSRNINNYENNLIKSNNLQKGSLYSTKEATPRKEHNKVLNIGKKKELNEEDSLSQFTEILKTNKKNLNYKELKRKIPCINDEHNFIFEQMLYNKSKIKKVKKLAQKISVLKLPIKNINDISSRKALPNSDRSEQYYSKGIKGIIDSNKKENKKDDDNVEVSCCIFGKK